MFVFSKPRAAYEVEFVAEDGSTVAELASESAAGNPTEFNPIKDCC